MRKDFASVCLTVNLGCCGGPSLSEPLGDLRRRRWRGSGLGVGEGRRVFASPPFLFLVLSFLLGGAVPFALSGGPAASAGGRDLLSEGDLARSFVSRRLAGAEVLGSSPRRGCRGGDTGRTESSQDRRGYAPLLLPLPGMSQCIKESGLRG